MNAFIIAFFVLLAGGSFSSALAELKIDITEGQIQPMPIAIPDFQGSSPRAQDLGRKIAQVVAADLERSGLFKPIDPNAFIQTDLSLQSTPRYEDWRLLKTQALVTGSVEGSTGSLVLKFRLFDIMAEEQLLALALNGDPAHWRPVAHKIADLIYSKITGETGYFNTRIVYVNVSGQGKSLRKRLAIMDYDGENHRFLTSGKNSVMSPRFSPTAHEIAFMEFEGNKANVHLMQTQTGQQKPIGQFRGLTFSPRFSPDGKIIVMSLAKGGVTTLQKMDLISKQVTPLTSGSMIDVSPSYSPDGSKIVFNSDRSGSQQLYVMDAGGGSAERISFGEGRYATPVWSPRGDWIAFTGIANGNFYIGVIKPDGSNQKTLAEGYLVDSPSWAPNGRVLMYMKEFRGGQRRLYSIDITGYNEREVKTPGNAEHPAWSPLIH